MAKTVLGSNSAIGGNESDEMLSGHSGERTLPMGGLRFKSDPYAVRRKTSSENPQVFVVDRGYEK